uniref:Si:dkey-8e10.2 n=1 Tax=Denticeps clupeoides TaxID=299321 RepID=A0AAY4DL18_9TELE
MNGVEGCAGMVQFGKEPSEVIHLCHKNWNIEEAQRVCLEVGCSKAENITRIRADPGITYNTKTFSCEKGMDFLWQCIDWKSTEVCAEPIAVICSCHQIYRLKYANRRENVCSGELGIVENNAWKPLKQAKNYTQRADLICPYLQCGNNGTIQEQDKKPEVSLKCADQVKILIQSRDGIYDKCYGSMVIQRNKTMMGVCANSDKAAGVACREAGCGELVFTQKEVPTAIRPVNQWKGVDCDGSEASLWQCNPYTKTFESCKMMKIYCSESIDVRLSDGFDKCAGRVEIRHEEKWWSVSNTMWTDANSNTVCAQLGCGQMSQHGHQLFANGATALLQLNFDCGRIADSIHKCRVTPVQSHSSEVSSTKLICRGHKMIFLEGMSSCSGTVRVQQESTQFWVSGLPVTWNETSAEYVCSQLHCGNVETYHYENQTKATMMEVVCRNNTGCTLDLAKAPSEAVATVKCSGNVTLQLVNNENALDGNKKRCWGDVEVCVGGRCGGVCEDAWTPDLSGKVCASLGCGHFIQRSDRELSPSVTIGSVHCPDHIKDITRCRYVLNSGSYCRSRHVSILCSGSLKARLVDSRDKCAGRAEIHWSGNWLPVCAEHPENQSLGATICRELKCGTVNSSRLFPSTALQAGLRATCNGVFSTVEKCTANKTFCAAGYFRCSDWSRLLITNTKLACQGPVFIMSTNGQHAVSSFEGQTELNLICKNLGCGEYKNHEGVSKGNYTWWGKTWKCQGSQASIWDCEVASAPTGAPEKQLDINCADGLRVDLSKKCYGEVQVNGKHKVCDSGWSKHMSEITPTQYCSILVEKRVTREAGRFYYFSCTGQEVSLLQCASEMVECNGSVSLVFSEGLKFRLTEGCGGAVQVNYMDNWTPACIHGGSEANRLCTDLLCGNFSKTEKTEKEGHPIQIKCSGENPSFLSHCVTRDAVCQHGSRVYCENYQEKKPFVRVGAITALAIGTLLLLVALGLVLWKRKPIINMIFETKGLSSKSNFSVDMDMERNEGRLLRFAK